ncbi:PucR family transcriptional regulator [Cohnella faecalis]|uniref:PucR family transcriptional regulator n=1 Tax=Cohnella faecalis TaxID=2315694 RepID=UPI0036226901
MQMTVEQALSVYPLSEGRLIAGSSGKSRIIRSVNVMDAPDITEWIKEGEMVFTTAFLIKDKPEEASRLLRKLDERGSSGLGIKLGRFWERVPESLIDEANELGFPLIELPYQFTFSDQMSGLFQAEIKRNTGLLQEVLDKQIRLMRFALRSGPIHRLFEAVSEVIGNPIAIVGSRGQVIYNASGFADTELGCERPWPVRPRWHRGESFQSFYVPLLKQDDCTGYVLFFTPRAFLSAIEESLYVQAAELLSFHLNFNFEDYAELSAHQDFGLLVKRHLKNGLPLEAVTDGAAKWEIELLNEPYRCALTDLPGRVGPVARTEGLESLKAEFIQHSRLQELRGIHVVTDDGLLSLFPDSTGDGGETLLHALGACLSDCRGTGDSAPRSTISSLKRKPAHLADAFRECKDTHRLAVDWGIAGRILKYETLDLAFIFEHIPKDRMQAYSDRWLGGLAGKDPEYVREMLRTLEAYLDNDGQLNETAKKLFIHRNTATYRIEKLSELLNVDFKSVDNLLRLKVVFLFRQMLNRAE